MSLKAQVVHGAKLQAAIGRAGRSQEKAVAGDHNPRHGAVLTWEVSERSKNRPPPPTPPPPPPPPPEMGLNQMRPAGYGAQVSSRFPNLAEFYFGSPFSNLEPPGSRRSSWVSSRRLRDWARDSFGGGSKDRNSKMGCPGKWKHGPKPAVCPSCLILSHTQFG